MKKIALNTLLSITLLFLPVLLFPKPVSASIGTVEIRSTTSESYRCYASSLILINNHYDIAVNCVDLIFPVQLPQISYYIIWIRPLSGKNPVKLGDLGKGVVRFETAEAFSSMFITLESNPNVRNPSSNVVMQGSVEPIEFLRRPTSPTPTPEVREDTGPGSEEQKTDTSQLSTRDKLLLALRRAGIAAVIALVAIVGLIFVVTRSRG